MARTRTDAFGQGIMCHCRPGTRRRDLEFRLQRRLAALSDLILEARGLYYRYDRKICALRGLDLIVRRGRKLAVLGANGAGKSTLFLHLNGTLRPEPGEILIDGRPAGYGRRELLEWRQQVGLVFQNPDDQLF